jgi:hypothetical protein
MVAAERTGPRQRPGEEASTTCDRQAFFVYLASFPQAPAVYAQQGALFCSVELNIDNSNEVGLPSSSPARVTPGREAERAKKEGAFCTDVFGHA